MIEDDDAGDGAGGEVHPEENGAKGLHRLNLETWSQLLTAAYCRLKWSVKYKMRIDLNSDLGESFGPWPMGQDAALMDSISSANVACGFHAGDPGDDAGDHRAGARQGRGDRRAPRLSGPGRLRPARNQGDARRRSRTSCSTRCRRSPAWRRRRACKLQHVKAHGALYNMACRDRALADAIARRSPRSIDR